MHFWPRKRKDIPKPVFNSGGIVKTQTITDHFTCDTCGKEMATPDRCNICFEMVCQDCEDAHLTTHVLRGEKHVHLYDHYRNLVSGASMVMMSGAMINTGTLNPLNPVFLETDPPRIIPGTASVFLTDDYWHKKLYDALNDAGRTNSKSPVS